MKKLITILLLLPCFCQAQTSTDTIIADTTTRITAKLAGSFNFDTIRISNYSIQGFTYDLKGSAPNVFSFAHIVVYVVNNNGVYSLVYPPTIPVSGGGSANTPGSPTNYAGVGMGNSFAINVVNNLIVVQYKAATANKTVVNWALTKTKIGL